MIAAVMLGFSTMHGGSMGEHAFRGIVAALGASIWELGGEFRCRIQTSFGGWRGALWCLANWRWQTIGIGFWS